MQKGFIFILLLVCYGICYAQEETVEILPVTDQPAQFEHRLDFVIQDVTGDDRTEELIGGLSLEYSASYRLDRMLMVGLGLGYQRLNRVDHASIPVFINLRGYILNKDVTPFYNLKMGKPLFLGKTQDPWENDIDYQKTWLWHPEVGMRLNSLIQMGIGYRINKFREHIVYSETNFTNRDITAKRWTFTFSMAF